MAPDTELEFVATALAMQTSQAQARGGLVKTAGDEGMAQGAKQLLSHVWHAAPDANMAINDPSQWKQLGLASLRNAAIGGGAGGAAGLLAAALQGRKRKSKWESMLHGGLLGASLGGIGTAGYYGGGAAARDITARWGKEGDEIARQARQEALARSAAPGASVIDVGRGVIDELGSAASGTTTLPEMAGNIARVVGGDTDGRIAGRVTGLTAGAATPATGRMLANAIRNAGQPAVRVLPSLSKPYLTRGMGKATLYTTFIGSLLGAYYDRYKAHQAAQLQQPSP